MSISPNDAAPIERLYLWWLGKRAGIRVASTQTVALRPGRLNCGHALAVQRFDREQRGDKTFRRHALSADVVLRAAGLELG